MTTSLQEQLRFLEIDPDSMELMREFGALLPEHLPAILDEFYKKNMQYGDIASKVTSTSMLDRLKSLQTEHWASLFSAQFDTAYMERIQRIGQAHNRIGLGIDWFVGSYLFAMTRLSGVIFKVYGKNRRTQNSVEPMVKALQKAIFYDIIGIVMEYNREVAKSAKEELKKEIRVIQGNTGEISQAMGETATAVNTVASAVEQLSASLRETANSAADAAKAASEADELSNNGRKTIAELESSAVAIDDVVNVIRNIAEQTNLLALNATIEAARAGEMGKGFAVVANEVKELSRQSATSTEQISKQVSIIQKQVKAVTDTIAAVNQSIERINQYNQVVASAVEQQSNATNEISSNIIHVASSSDEVKNNLSRVNEVATRLVQ